MFFDKKKGLYAYSGGGDWLLAEPLWVAAERQGVKAATYFAGSETDWQGQSTSYRIAPFDGSRPEADKVNKIIEWLDLPVNERPRLIMSYWKGADTTGHFHGPNPDAIVEDINEQDVELGRVLQAVDSRNLWPKTTLIIVSDHGMTRVTESVEFEGALKEAGLDVTVTGAAAGQHVYLKKPYDEGAVLKILYMNPHLTILQGDDIPTGMAARNRTGDIVVIAEPLYTLNRGDSLLTKAIVFFSPMLGWEWGAHGFNPDLPDMGGIFFAMGRGVSAGKKIDNVHQRDIAPTVADILGIDAPAGAKNLPVSLR
jgi:predicted AlkP superfamily pyrophosphatase or phosphodiesterase